MPSNCQNLVALEEEEAIAAPPFLLKLWASDMTTVVVTIKKRPGVDYALLMPISKGKLFVSGEHKDKVFSLIGKEETATEVTLSYREV